MNNSHDLELMLRSRTPIILVETHEEQRLLDLLVRLMPQLAKPLFKWTITEGLSRYDLNLDPMGHVEGPDGLLKHIKAARLSAIYVLLDFHPYLNDPVHVRLLKDIASQYEKNGITVILVSHRMDIPDELQRYTAKFEMALPDKRQIARIVQNLAIQYQQQNHGRKVSVDNKAFDMLVQNLQGLTESDAKRLAHNVIFYDGAISHSDIPEITKTKYQLLGQDSALSFEYDTSKFSDVGGMTRLKAWLQQRQAAFTSGDNIPGLDPPKGILLLGVQGCGKSLAAKAVAGLWGLPLLRLDFGTLFDKYYGETERNLRDALKTAGVMAPCVLWIDELEKSIAPGDVDSGPSRRVLATLLTWMSEKSSQIFLVATANDIKQLPPELVRKGRFDEIFFVDLPKPDIRRSILSIHLQARQQDPHAFNLDKLAEVSEGFSGAELEQAVVSALYAAHAVGEKLADVHILEEISRTRPLSVVMAEQIGDLRSWASNRTVPVD